MRGKKWLVLITGACALVSLLLMIIFYKLYITLGYDIAMAVFGSALLGFVMSLIEYFSARYEAMEKFWLEGQNVLTLLNKIRPVALAVSGDLLVDCFAEADHNERAEQSNIPSIKKSDEARKKYEAVVGLYNELSQGEISDELKNDIYNKEIKSQREYFSAMIDNYVSLSSLNVTKLDNAYGNLDFIFANKTIRKEAWDTLEEIRQLKNSDDLSHLMLYKKGVSKNFTEAARRCISISEYLFTNEDMEIKGSKMRVFYPDKKYQIEEALENFRVKIYYSKVEKEEIKKDPVESLLISGIIDEKNKKEKE